MVSQNYQLDQKYAGFIIGPKGAGIKSLKGMSGVINVSLDTRSSRSLCTLTVKAYDMVSCEAVIAEVQKRIARKSGAASRIANVRKIFIDANINDNKVLFTPVDQSCSSKHLAVVLKSTNKKTVFSYNSFKKAESHELFGNMKVGDTVSNSDDWINLDKNVVTDSFEEALKTVKQHKTLEFNVSPGKLVLVGPNTYQDVILYRSVSGTISVQQLKNSGLKPVYITFLNPRFSQQMSSNLEKEGFKCLNEGSPDAYTTVHLYAGQQQARFSVKLALDGNLEELKDEKSDIRLSDEKKEAVERVFKATTIGDVIGELKTKSLKIAYRKLTLLLHPDKNCHPGATDAFKKLQHAFDSLSEGRSLSTAALKIQENSESKTDKPPKVISVKTDKSKVCTFTTFSSQPLDLRASLVTYEDDTEGLSAHIRSVLNSCWEKRDEKGGIPTPEGKTGIYIECVKQTKAAHIWAKEIETETGTVIFEVTVKEIRERIENQVDWQDCIEIDMVLDVGGIKSQNLSANELMHQFIRMNEAWKNLCPKI